MSDESNPKSKREFDEALSQSVVSPLQKKTKKLDDDDDQNVVVLADSDSVASSADSASGGSSVKSVDEEEEQSSSFSSGCFTGETNGIATKNLKSVVDLEAPQISEAETETETFITTDLRKEERNPVNEALGETTEIESLSATEGDDSEKQPAVSKTPTAEEIEDFFTEVEEDGDKKKRFMEKYNFDIVNDQPLQGRFKWDPIN